MPSLPGYRPGMTTIAGVAGVVPDHLHTQDEITDVLGEVVLGRRTERRALLRQVHASAGVRTRHLALPLDAYAELGDFGATNDTFIEVGVGLAERAVRGALAGAGLTPSDIDGVQGGPMSKRFLIPTALLATLVGALSLGAASALAKDGDVLARGSCTGASSAKLKLSPENGRIEVEFEVDQNRNGVRWNVVLTRNGVRVASLSRVTRGPSGSPASR